MQRLIFNLEDHHVAALDRLVNEAEFGTDRSKAIRAILDEFFERRAMQCAPTQ